MSKRINYAKLGGVFALKAGAGAAAAAFAGRKQKKIESAGGTSSPYEDLSPTQIKLATSNPAGIQIFQESVNKPPSSPGASFFSNGVVTSSAPETKSLNVTTEEPTAVPAKIENFQTMLNELTALNTGTTSPSTTPTPTETSPAPAPTPTVTDATRQELIDETLGKKYSGGMSAAELQDFETLIGRLEGSKMRQAGQLNRARQREKYSGGLASMMRNF